MRRPQTISGAFVIDVLGKIWASPNTLLGLALGLATVVIGSRAALCHNAIVFNSFPFGRRAFVLGNIILNPARDLTGPTVTYESLALSRRTAGGCTLDHVNLGKHEEAHTLQYQLLGPFFLPVYALTQLLPSPTPLERAADFYAKTGKGWWPWQVGRSLPGRRHCW